MKIRGQDRDARELRLVFGRCPVHGFKMTVVELVQESEWKEKRMIVECPRCHLRGDALGIDGPVILFQNHMGVLEETPKKSKAKK